MTTGTINTEELFQNLKKTFAELEQTLSSATEESINIIPFENSWTAAQVTDHVTRSINGMKEALGMPGKVTDRNPDEKEKELSTLFLNFEKKMKSPPFILPTQDIYEKALLIKNFKDAVTEFNTTANNVNLSELINLQPLGELTRLEVIYFILYHTQRHTQQIKNILERINSNK